MRKAKLEDGYYDPNPRRRFAHLPRFPTPSFPVAVIPLALIGVAGLVLYTNTDNLDHLINVFDAEFKSLDQEEQKKHREWYKNIIAVILVFILLVSIWYIYDWRKKVKEAKMGFV